MLVIAGKDHGKKGKVLRVFPREAKIVVEGVYVRKKHVKARRVGQKGQIVEVPGAFSVASVKLICSKCGKPTRVGYTMEGSEKIRICKKCGAAI